MVRTACPEKRPSSPEPDISLQDSPPRMSGRVRQGGDLAAQLSREPIASGAPAAADRPLVDAQKLGHPLLAPAVIEGQADDLSLVRRQRFHTFVEAAPAIKFLGVGPGIG